MAATITVNGSNVTLSFAWTTTQAIALATAGSAAEELFNRGMGNHGTEAAPRLFAALSNQEKVDILDAYFLASVNALARDHAANVAADAARQASLANSANNLHL